MYPLPFLLIMRDLVDALHLCIQGLNRARDPIKVWFKSLTNIYARVGI